MLILTRCFFFFSFLSSDSSVPGREDARRLPRQASGEILQPGSTRNLPRARDEGHHRAPRGTRRAERHVLHDPSRRIADGMQHLRPGRWAPHQGDIVLLDALQRAHDPLAVQGYPPSGDRRARAHVGAGGGVLAGPRAGFDGAPPRCPRNAAQDQGHTGVVVGVEDWLMR